MKRPYKEPWSVEDSMAEIKRGAGSHFDPRLVDLFEEVLPQIKEIKDEWDQKELLEKKRPAVMIVDDDPHFREVMRVLLQSQGLRIAHEVGDGKKAIELLKDDSIELVFLDIIMPNMDGLDVLKQIMEDKPNMKVIMLTSVDEETSHKKCLEMGAKDYLLKGKNPTLIANAIERLILKL
jgi:response regulator RpfG family c-di-GMP phosphodiesterase